MGVPLFSDQFLLKQAQQLLQSPTALIPALDPSDWDPIKRHGELHPQLDAALRAQESAAVIHSRALDPASGEARGIILRNLTRNLSQLARQCVYDLDSQILARATRFDEHRANGVMTIRVFGLDLNHATHPESSTHTDTTPSIEQQIGICLTRIGSDGQSTSFLPDDDELDRAGDDDEGDALHRALRIPPRAPQPQSRTLLHNRREQSAGPTRPIPTLRIDILPPALGTAGEQAMMSPSAGVFHTHTLDHPLEIPPPSSRRSSPAPVFGSTSLGRQLRDAIRIRAPPAGSRNTTRRTSEQLSAAREAEARRRQLYDTEHSARVLSTLGRLANPREQVTLAHPRRRADRPLGEGWADAARAAAATQTPTPPAAGHFVIDVAQTLLSEVIAQVAAGGADEFDPNGDTPPPLEYALPHLAGIEVVPGHERRSELSAAEMGVVLSPEERARLGVLPAPEPLGGVASRQVRHPEGWAPEQEEVASEEV